MAYVNFRTIAGKTRNVLGLGTAIAVTQGALVYGGGRIDSFKKESDEFERKEILRRTTRVPYTQTMDVGNRMSPHLNCLFAFWMRSSQTFTK